MTSEAEPVSTVPPEPLGPVSVSERVETIDTLRGLALVGILAANMRGFSGPADTYFTPHLFWPATPDRIAQAFVTTFVQGKFVGIFAFLFGVGFAVQLERAAARGARFGGTYARRLIGLFAIGLVHGLLIWYGDILLPYALGGFVLLLLGKRSDKTLVIVAAICLAVMPLVMTGAFVAAQLGAKMPDLNPTAAEIAHAADTYGKGTWLEIQRLRARDAMNHNWGFMPVFLWQIVGLFLLGVLAWRKRVFHPAPESLPRYRAAMAWALGVGVTGSVAATIVRWVVGGSMLPTTWLQYSMALVQAVCVPALSLGYVVSVILACHDDRTRARLRPFAAVGRTALTNYLLQSVIGTLMFYSYGLGWFGMGPLALLPLTIVIFVVQMMASVWWLERYRFGPVEWLWRRLTYGEPLPMRRAIRAVDGVGGNL